MNNSIKVMSDIEARPDARGICTLFAIYILDQLYRKNKISFATAQYTKHRRLLYLVWVAYAMCRPNNEIPTSSPMSAFKFYRYDAGPAPDFELAEEDWIYTQVLRNPDLTSAYRFVNQSLSPVEMAHLNNAIKIVRKHFLRYDTYSLNAITCDSMEMTRRIGCFQYLEMSPANIRAECRAMSTILNLDKNKKHR